MTPAPSVPSRSAPAIPNERAPAIAPPEVAWWVRLLPAGVLGAAVAQALWVGWGRWGDVLLDVGRELEWPRRMVSGDRLYSELRYYYGPLAPHVNALLYRIFGVHLDVLATAGAVSGAAAVAVIYLLARRFMGRFGSTAVALVFVYAVAFGHQEPVGIFNWVLPYTYAATYGMLAALLSLLFLVRHVQQAGRLDLGLSVSFLVLAALSKVEVAVPSVACHATFLLAAIARRRDLRRTLSAYGLGGLALALAYGGLLLRVGPALWRDNLAGVVNADSAYFISFMAGFDDVAGRLPYLGASVLFAAAFAAFAYAAAHVAERRARSRVQRALVVGVGVVAALAVARFTPPDVPWLAAPLVLAVALVRAAPGAFRERAAGAGLPFVLLCVFALAALPRIALGVAPIGYGFYLLPGALVGTGVVLFELLPGRVAEGRHGRAAIAAVSAALLLGNAAAFYLASLGNFEAKTVRVASPRGGLWSFAPDAEVLGRELGWVSRLPLDACVVALPDASSLNFFSGRSSCAPLASYLPMELHGAFADDALRARWEQSPPDLVVWTDRTMPEFGGARFGATYATATARWLREHYRPVTDPRLPGVVLVRR